MLDELLGGLTKGGSGNILLILFIILLFSGSLDGIFDGHHGDGSHNNILLILLVIFLMGDFF